MTAFAFVDADGVPTGGGVRPEVPPGAVVLTPPFTTADLPRLRWTGSTWVLREIESARLAPVAAVLDAARIEAGRAVARMIEAFRGRLVTPLPGQDRVYQLKREEAGAFLRQVEQAGDARDLAQFPLLAGEVGVTGDTAWQVAQVWLNRADAVDRALAASDAARHRALAEIACATDEAAVEAAVFGLASELDGLAV